MEIKNLFFSYSRADGADFALRLAVDLQKEGFNVWIDQQNIRAGSEWDLEIEKALETCDCLLIISGCRSLIFCRYPELLQRSCEVALLNASIADNKM